MDVKILQKKMCYKTLIEYLENEKRYRLLTTEELDSYGYSHLTYCEDTLLTKEESDRVIMYSPRERALKEIAKGFRIPVLLVKTQEYLSLMDTIVINDGNITKWVNDVIKMFDISSPLKDGEEVIIRKPSCPAKDLSDNMKRMH